MEVGSETLSQVREELAQARAQADREYRHQEAMLQRLQTQYEAERAARSAAELQAQDSARALEAAQQELARVRGDWSRAANQVEALHEELRRLAMAYDDLKFLKGSK